MSTTPTTPNQIVSAVAQQDALDNATADVATHVIVMPDAATGLATRVRSNVPLTDAEPVTCSYDKACFIGEGFGRAAASLDNWVVVQSREDQPVKAQYAHTAFPSESAARMHRANMFTPPFITEVTENMTAHICLQEMLADTVAEVYFLPPAEQGHYLAQLVTRWFSDGTIDWMRFRIANLLARYYSMMPPHSDPMNEFEVNDDLTVHGWSTDHGIYLDLVHVFKQDDVHIEDDIDAVLDYADRTWPDAIAGIRYLPLEDLRQARLYNTDGTYTRVLQRDLLDLEMWREEPMPGTAL